MAAARYMAFVQERDGLGLESGPEAERSATVSTEIEQKAWVSLGTSAQALMIPSSSLEEVF